MKEKYDVIIIGSGISGMTCAMYLKRGGLDVLIIEESTPGGQLNKINTISNYPGFLQIDGPSLAEKLYNQMNELDIKYLFDKVLKTNLEGDVKQVITTKYNLTCKYLVIATGRMSKQLFTEDERYIGKGISYCALCDGNLYKNKNVIVVGGANSAMEEALYLSNICNTVTMIIRSESLKGEEELKQKILLKNNIQCVYNSSITEYNIENNKIVSIKLENEEVIDTDGLFISIGSVPSAEIFDVDKNSKFIVVDNHGMTNINNVYACGDVTKKEVYQLTTAASDGTIVANSIIKKNKK